MGLFATLNELIGNNTWPPKSEVGVWEDVSFLAALRMSDEEQLRQHESIPWNAPYVVTPVPRMISRASANMLFGADPDIGADDDGDAERYQFIASENGLTSELHRGALLASSEGDVWGKVVVAPGLADAPIIEFVSRGSVIPWFRGRFVDAVTFVTQWATGTTERYRLFETYGRGYVTAELYRGGRVSIGVKRSLNSFPATAGMVERVNTGVSYPLAEFIPNSFDASLSRGFSDYRGLEARFLSINEATTVGASNLRLAGKKRALVDADYLGPDGRLAKDADLLIKKNKNRTLGESGKPLELLEYSFEAEALVRWLDHLIDTTLTFAGISPQTAGRGDIGVATSGTALKLRMAHSLMEASGKGRHADRGAKRLLRAAGAMDALYFRRRYTNLNTLPSFERRDALPTDDMEAALIVNNLVAAEAISTEEKVRYLHPDWTKEEVAAEVASIEGEQASAAPPTVTPPPIQLPA